MTDEHLARLVAERMTLPYHRVVRGDSVNGFVAEVAELPGCMTGASTAGEAFEQLDEAMELWPEGGDPGWRPDSGAGTCPDAGRVRRPAGLHLEWSGSATARRGR